MSAAAPASAPPSSTLGGESTAGGGRGAAGHVKDFDLAYESAADAAAMELMQRATQRGEKFSAAVTRPDFVAAVGVMASHLGLALDAPNIEQLFHAVSGGGPTVQFEDFIEAHSTRYYLKELAGANPTAAGARRGGADADVSA